MKVKSIRIILFILISGLIFLACKKDSIIDIPCSQKSNTIEDVRKILPGSYSWAYSKITFQGSASIETPASTGRNYQYIFDNNGRVLYYENNVLAASDSYTIDYEFRVTTFPSDSATIVIIRDSQTGQRKEFFRPYICTDSSLFYNPYNSIDVKRYFRRN
jgi:hypothetical protein